MKYWVYKNSRIHGPFDKDAFAGFPGVDAATLVSAGESAASAVGGWQPAGEVSDLAGIALETGPRWSQDEPPSAYGLLDKLQIESAGLVDDSDFPGTTLDIFQDAEQRKNFADLLNPRLAAAEAELRRSKDRVSEFTTLLEKLYKRVAELESSQTDLMHRLAAKEAALRLQPPTMMAAVAPPVAAAPVAAPPVVVPPVVEIPVAALPVVEAPVAAAPVAAPPAVVSPVVEIPVAKPPVVEAPVAAAPVAAPPAVVSPAVEIPVAKPPVVEAPVAAAPVVEPPVIAPLVVETPVAEVPVAEPPVVAPPVVEAPVEATPAAEAAAPKKVAYPKALHFKVVPTVRSFRVASPDAPAETRPAAPAQVPTPVSAAVPAPAPVPLQPPVPVPTPAPVEASVAAPVIEVVALPSLPAAEPMAAPAPVAEPVFEDMAGAPASTPAPTQAPAAEPPATMSYAWGGQPEAPAAPPPSTQEVLARLAKPASAPQTAPPPRQARSNKPFLVAGAALVALLGAIGYFILHQPKDLNQMVSLDDSREHLGAQPADDSAPLPPAKPQAAEEPSPEPAPEPAREQPVAAAPPAAGQDSGAQPAAEAELDAAVALVKDFPLDGGRGTVAHWLQYSYNASPDAGKETWSASSTGDQGYLVEYRFTPTARGGADVHYLFAADMSMGLIFGKNLEAQRMLAGSAPRAADEKPRAKAKAKTKAKAPRPAARRAAKRAVVSESAKEVPLMPLPNEGELTPPAEDAAAFGSDTVNPGL